MIRIKNSIFNENEIVKIQFDDGSKEMEIDHKNGNRTFIDGTFDDIEWNYENIISESLSYNLAKTKIQELEEENKKLKEEYGEFKKDYSTVVAEYKKLQEELSAYKNPNNYIRFARKQVRCDYENLQQTITNAINYINGTCCLLASGNYIDLDKDDVVELLKILKGKE